MGKKKGENEEQKLDLQLALDLLTEATEKVSDLEERLIKLEEDSSELTRLVFQQSNQIADLYKKLVVQKYEQTEI